MPNNQEDPRLAEILEIIFKFATGELTARGNLAGDNSALDGVMAGINILGEELAAHVAENKQTQEALQRTLDYAQTLIGSSPDGILAVDLDLRITEWNLLMAQICGITREQVIGRSMDEIPFLKETGEVARTRLAFEGKSIGAREIGYRFPGTDKEIFFESLMAPLLGPAQQVQGAVLRVRDITENRQVQQALSDSEALFRTIFDTVQEGIIVVDAQNHRVKMANDSMCHMLRYSREELLRLGVADIHPAKNLADVAHWIERQLKCEISLAPNLPVQRKDGSIFYADINAKPMQVKGDSFLLGVFSDITVRKRAEEAEERASRDSLTNLYNHHTFYSLLQDEIVRSQRFNHPMSLLMLDIDHFKRINDIYGHQAGDAILKGLSNFLLKQGRTVDKVCRYGGEEFAVILPETASGLQIAERLRATVEAEPFEIAEGKLVSITVSIGVATCPHDADNAATLVSVSDKALYAAKEGGRNRVFHSVNPDESEISNRI